ncbi:hypothetical protein GCM10028815_26440 [Mariniluteicoccus flavus]
MDADGNGAGGAEDRGLACGDLGLGAEHERLGVELLAGLAEGLGLERVTVGVEGLEGELDVDVELLAVDDDRGPGDAPLERGRQCTGGAYGEAKGASDRIVGHGVLNTVRLRPRLRLGTQLASAPPRAQLASAPPRAQLVHTTARVGCTPRRVDAVRAHATGGADW